jgi:ankyrin repeat and zinc finger domain-containing protein 1
MADSDKTHPLLQKPLYIYSLPSEILDTITLRDNVTSTLPAAKEETKTNDQNRAKETKVEDVAGNGVVGCATCNISAFADVAEQREHVRHDLHKFNLKRSLISQPVVSADEFDKMLDGILAALVC